MLDMRFSINCCPKGVARITDDNIVAAAQPRYVKIIREASIVHRDENKSLVWQWLRICFAMQSIWVYICEIEFRASIVCGVCNGGECKRWRDYMLCATGKQGRM